MQRGAIVLTGGSGVVGMEVLARLLERGDDDVIVLLRAAGQSLRTKPDAPAARAAPGEIRPAPEMSSTLVIGDSERSRSQISAPDSWPTKRSTRATCGS